MNNEQLSLKLFIVLTRALQAVRKRVEEHIKSIGLNPTEFAVLELLYNNGEQPIQKIGDQVLIASSSITYVIDKLEGREFVVRKPSPDDRRITFASITSKGKAFMDEVFPDHKQAIVNIFAGLNKQEKELIIEQLKKLGYYAQQMNEE